MNLNLLKKNIVLEKNQFLNIKNSKKDLFVEKHSLESRYIDVDGKHVATKPISVKFHNVEFVGLTEYRYSYLSTLYHYNQLEAKNVSRFLVNFSHIILWRMLFLNSQRLALVKFMNLHSNHGN